MAENYWPPLQLTVADNATYVGAKGEPVMVLDDDGLVAGMALHDGITLGGVAIPYIDAATGAHVNPVTGSASVVGPIITDTPANNLIGLQAQVDQFGYAFLPRGTTQISACLTLGDGATLTGHGAGGLSTLKLASASNDNVIRNADRANGNRGIQIRNLVIDGNKSGQTSVLNGIDLLLPNDLTIDNVEIKNVKGIGIYAVGTGQASCTNGWISRVYSHDNAGSGAHFGNGFRRVKFSDITAIGNAVNGWIIDISEAEAHGIKCHANTQWGIYIRNVTACNLNGLEANCNGAHGIHVLGLNHSIGSNWSAHNNGQSASGSDVYFNEDNTFGYGTTKDTVISGLNVGATDQSGFQWSGGIAQTPVTEEYGLSVDDGVTDNVAILNVRCSVAGTLGSFRAPSSAGNLVITTFPFGNAAHNVFRGNMLLQQGYFEARSITAPSAPANNGGRLFTRQNGSSKTELCVIFKTGAIQIIATEP